MVSDHPVVTQFSGGPANVFDSAYVRDADHREFMSEDLSFLLWPIVPGHPRRNLVQDDTTFDAEFVGHASKLIAVVVSNATYFRGVKLATAIGTRLEHDQVLPCQSFGRAGAGQQLAVQTL
jgi:hypothetical protein